TSKGSACEPRSASRSPATVILPSGSSIMSTSGDAWTAERLELTARWWRQGVSAGVIATRLQVTRNSVISRPRSLGLPGIARVPTITLQPCRRPVRCDEPPEPPAPEPLRISVEQLTGRTCRWPVGWPGAPGFGFCGHRTRDGSVYCEAHHRAAYTRE